MFQSLEARVQPAFPRLLCLLARHLSQVSHPSTKQMALSRATFSSAVPETTQESPGWVPPSLSHNPLVGPSFAYSWTELGDCCQLTLLWVTEQGPSPLWALGILCTPKLGGLWKSDGWSQGDPWSSALVILVQDTYREVASLPSCPPQGRHSHTWRR